MLPLRRSNVIPNRRDKHGAAEPAIQSICAGRGTALIGTRALEENYFESAGRGLDIAGAHQHLRGAVDDMLLGTVLRALRQSR